MNKLEKLNNEIKGIERDLEKIDAELSKITGITDEQISKILTDEGHWSHRQFDWKQIIKNGAAGNFNNSEAEYLETVEQNKRKGIEFWRTQNIKWPTQRRKDLEKRLVKLRAKLQGMM